MKKTFIVFLVSLLSLVLGFTLLSKSKFKPALAGAKDVSSFGLNVYKVFNNEKENKESQTISVKGVKEYVLEFSAAEVVLHYQKDGVTDVSYDISYTGDKMPLEISKNKNTLFMNLTQKKGSLSFVQTVKLDLYLPKIKKPYPDVKINLQAGSLTLKPELSFNTFVLDVSAGSFKSESLSFKKGEVNLSAGEAEFLSVAAPEVRMEVSGGSAHFNSAVQSTNFEAHVQAGALRYGSIEGLEKNFTLYSNVTVGELDVVEGYKKSGDEYIFGDGSGRVYIEVDMGSVEVY